MSPDGICDARTGVVGAPHPASALNEGVLVRVGTRPASALNEGALARVVVHSASALNEGVLVRVGTHPASAPNEGALARVGVHSASALNEGVLVRVGTHPASAPNEGALAWVEADAPNEGAPVYLAPHAGLVNNGYSSLFGDGESEDRSVPVRVQLESHNFSNTRNIVSSDLVTADAIAPSMASTTVVPPDSEESPLPQLQLGTAPDPPPGILLQPRVKPPPMNLGWRTPLAVVPAPQSELRRADSTIAEFIARGSDVAGGEPSTLSHRSLNVLSVPAALQFGDKARLDARVAAIRSHRLVVMPLPTARGSDSETVAQEYQALDQQRSLHLASVAERLAGVADNVREEPAWRRRLAMHLARVAMAGAERSAEPEPYFCQTLGPVAVSSSTTDVDAFPTSTSLPASPPEPPGPAMNPAPPGEVGRWVGDDGRTPLISPPAWVNREQRRVLLAAVAAEGGSSGVLEAIKPDATNPQAMFLASPLAPDGRADAVCKASFRAVVEDLRCRVALPLDAPDPLPSHTVGTAPRVRAVDMIREHRKYSDMCLHCIDGTCTVIEVAALAEACPVILHGAQEGQLGPSSRDRIMRGERPDQAEYNLTPAEVALRKKLIAAQLLEGSIELCSHAEPVISPTLFAYKQRFIASELIAEQVLKSGDATQLAERIAALAVAAGESELSAGGSFAAGVLRGLAEQSCDDKPRMCTGYGFNNDLGVGWPMAMSSTARLAGRMTPGTWCASTDVEKGFPHLVVNPADRHLLAFCIDGVVYQPVRFFFGLRQTPAQFSTVTAEVVTTTQRAIWRKLGRHCGVWVDVYMDDIFIFAPTRQLCQTGLDALFEYCKAVGIVLKSDKTRAPCQVAPLLGLEGDSVANTLRVPALKRVNYLVITVTCEAIARAGRRIPGSLLRKLVGKLASIAPVMSLAPLWLGPLWAVADKVEPQAWVVGGPQRSAMRWFASQLAMRGPLQVPLLPVGTSPLSPPAVASFSDASGDHKRGFAISLGPVVIHGTWRVGQVPPTIGGMEFYPWVVLFALAGDLLDGLIWAMRADNLPNVYNLLRGRTHDRGATPLLAALLVEQARPRMGATAAARFAPWWLPRRWNTFQDGLSKSIEQHEVLALSQQHLNRVRSDTG